MELEKTEHLIIGSLTVLLERSWLGITKRRAFKLCKSGKYKLPGEVYGDGDMKEPFFKYIGAI